MLTMKMILLFVFFFTLGEFAGVAIASLCSSSKEVSEIRKDNEDV